MTSDDRYVQAMAGAAHTSGMADLQPEELERLLDIDEVAAYLRVSKHTLYKWRVNGGGPRALRYGKHLRWRRRDVETWLDSQYEDSPSADGEAGAS